MAHNQHLLWTIRGTKASSKDNLDPNIFFSSENTGRSRQGRPVQRVKSAAPRIGRRHLGIKNDNNVNASPSGSHSSFLHNPSPTPVTSRPLSSRSGRSSYSSMQKNKQEPSASPTSLFLQLHKARCKSAPPRPVHCYLPQKSKAWQSRDGSASPSSRSAPKRAWQNRISSAKSQHSLMSREEVEKRHRGHCKSAPLPYDFSGIEVVTSVPRHGSDIQRLKAFTRPLTCMPDIIRNVLSHNGLKHCCSAYQPRPKSSPSSRQQFWPVARPTVFQRGDVPKYLHFVKPAGFWVRGEGSHPKTCPDDDPSLLNDNQLDFPLNYEDDFDETVLFEEQFIVPASPSEASFTEGRYSTELRDEELQTEQNLDTNPCEGLTEKYLNDKEGEGVKYWPDNQMTHVSTQEQPQADVKTSDADPLEPVAEIIITKLEPDQSPSPENAKEEQTEASTNDECDADIHNDVPEIPQWAAQEDMIQAGDISLDEVREEVVVPEPVDEPAQIEKEPENEVEDEPVAQKPSEVPQKAEEETHKAQKHQVKFSDSLILTSFKSPSPKEEKKEPVVKPILKPSPTFTRKEPKVAPGTQKRTTPLFERKEVEKPPLPKPPPVAPVQSVEAMKTEDEEKKLDEEGKKLDEEGKVGGEREEVSPKQEPEVLPRPEYIRAPGAYRMYDPKDLLEYRLEQKRESRPLKKSLTNSTVPRFLPSAEATEVMTSIRDEHKQRKEGMKPWLQGRLALSKQTSRFELPMDVKLLEAMTPMEYLTKYCIISTRRKALYKHIFQKVDKDRDNQITFKEMNRGLREIHVDSISTEQIKKLIEMVEGNEKSTFSLAQFSAIAAFSERLLLSETQVTEKNNPYSSKEIIEEADFCGLKSKLSGFPVNPNVRKILEVL